MKKYWKVFEKYYIFYYNIIVQIYVLYNNYYLLKSISTKIEISWQTLLQSCNVAPIPEKNLTCELFDWGLILNESQRYVSYNDGTYP